MSPRVARRHRYDDGGGSTRGYYAGSSSAPATAFVPAVAGYSVLLDSTNAATVTNAAGLCTAWANTGSAGGSTTPLATNPTITAAGLGGRTTLTFNGASTRMLLVANGVGGLQPYTLFLVAQNTDAGATQRTPFLLADGGGGDGRIYRENSDQISGYAGITLGSGASWGSPGGAHAVAFVANGVSSRLSVDSSAPVGPSNGGGTGPGVGLTIGATNAAAEFWLGNISLIQVYPGALTAPQVAANMAALKTYFGTP